jgi:hypothetical protein
MLAERVPIERARLPENGLSRQLGVDRDEIVATADLHPVAGVEKDGDVCGLEQLREAADARVEVALVDVDAENDIEARRLQRRCDVVGVVAGVGKRRHLLVGRVADDERHSFFGSRRQDEEHTGGDEGKQDAGTGHGVSVSRR